MNAKRRYRRRRRRDRQEWLAHVKAFLDVMESMVAPRADLRFPPMVCSRTTTTALSSHVSLSASTRTSSGAIYGKPH